MREKPQVLLKYFDPMIVRHIWWMHWETFSPGHFDCNIDPNPKISDPQFPKGFMQIPSFEDWITLDNNPN